MTQLKIKPSLPASQANALTTSHEAGSENKVKPTILVHIVQIQLFPAPILCLKMSFSKRNSQRSKCKIDTVTAICLQKF